MQNAAAVPVAKIVAKAKSAKSAACKKDLNFAAPESNLPRAANTARLVGMSKEVKSAVPKELKCASAVWLKARRFAAKSKKAKHMTMITNMDTSTPKAAMNTMATKVTTKPATKRAATTMTKVTKKITTKKKVTITTKNTGKTNSSL